MIPNPSIFKQTVETAKAECAGNTARLRAIYRDVVANRNAKYWSFADGVLTR